MIRNIISAIFILNLWLFNIHGDPDTTLRWDDIADAKLSDILLDGVLVGYEITLEWGKGFQLAPFDYYTKQGDESASQQENCGPAVVSMAVRYGSANQLKPVPDLVRSEYMGLGREDVDQRTGPEDFIRALEYTGAKFTEIHDADTVWEAVNQFHTVIVPVRMRDVALSSYESLSIDGQCAPGRTRHQYGENSFCYESLKDLVVGNFKPFSYDNTNPFVLEDGHVVLVNGAFTDTGGERYFFIYDPNVFGENDYYYMYGDLGLPKGQFRLWTYSDLERALKNNRGRAFEVWNNPADPIMLADPGMNVQEQVKVLVARLEQLLCSAGMPFEVFHGNKGVCSRID